MILARNNHFIINISYRFSSLLVICYRRDKLIKGQQPMLSSRAPAVTNYSFRTLNLNLNLNLKPKYSFSLNNRYEKVEIKKKNEQKQLQEEEKNKDSNGYGYYDWNDDSSYKKVIEDQYFLDDLIIGFKTLAKKQILFNEDHLTFMVYTYLLFQTKVEKQFAQSFIPNFLRLQSQENSESIKRKYIPLVKLLCFCANNKIKQINKVSRPYLSNHIEPILRKRLGILTKNLNLEQFNDIITDNCYEHMGNMQKQFGIFKEILNNLFEKKKYKIDWNEIRLITSIYQKLILFDNELRNKQFFCQFPGIFETDQESFVNLVCILPEILTFNFTNFTSDSDLQRLNRRISQCTQFKKKETKTQLRRYSQHLVLIDKTDLINFQKVLDFV